MYHLFSAGKNSVYFSLKDLKRCVDFSCGGTTSLPLPFHVLRPLVSVDPLSAPIPRMTHHQCLHVRPASSGRFSAGSSQAVVTRPPPYPAPGGPVHGEEMRPQKAVKGRGKGGKEGGGRYCNQLVKSPLPSTQLPKRAFFSFSRLMSRWRRYHATDASRASYQRA